ncbi:MAG: alpha-mannosidase-like protein, alpha-mannosidase [Chloroflexi bacterium CSP1-4]|nr:MAG: alpha-mannosidase-like protein, alpha-mannosidase [Chloroflexi bacterium CSP1-4]
MKRAAPRIVHLVPHTHWDREWYLPFQSFRLRLVELVDGLLDEMEADPRVRFTLDGQTATVDDYLEVRPENEQRVARLVAAGRLAVGPWRILMDEFLVSGETLVRNLEQGMRRATELGRVMAIGYLPDMFGHVAQMPQLLRRAGIEDAVVWRGVPAAIDRHVFAWTGPDGSTVRCEYLLGGYGNGRDVLSLPDRIGHKLDVYVRAQLPAFGDDEILAMYGEDHSLPLPGYAGHVAAFNGSQDRYELRIATLAEYITATRARSLPERSWPGELRSGARANVLMGVTSHRIEVRQAAGRVERLLERVAEPLLALYGDVWPERLLDLAWRRVVENSAHDSICACSAEATVAQVQVRFAEAEQIARGVTERALSAIGRRVAEGAFVAVNPSPTARTDLVELEVLAANSPVGAPLVAPDGSPAPTQDLGVLERVVDDVALEAGEVVPYLRRRMHARELYTYQVNGYVLEGTAAETIVILDVDRVPDPPDLDVDALLEELDALATRAPGAPWRLQVVARPRRRLLAMVTVPPLGWTALAAGVGPSVAPGSAVVASARGLANGLASVTVAHDGTLTIGGSDVTLRGVGRLVDGGDVGDSYNYAPPPSEMLVDRPSRVTVTAGETGPLRADLVVTRTYVWPRGLLDDLSARTAETVEVDVRTRVELRAGEDFVRIALEFDNRSLDHRLRFHIPLPAPTDRSFAEGQFAIVERGLEMEGGHGEWPLPTFPAHGFIAVAGVAVLLDHVLEYELVDGGELALTVLRATGLISRDRHPWRDEPAGPVIAAPTGQAQGLRRLAFAILPHAATTPGARVLEAAERYRQPFLTTIGSGPRQLALTEATGLAVEGEGVVMTSLRRRGDALELRLVNESGEGKRAVIRGSFTSTATVDLLGRPQGDERTCSGVVERLLGPWEIATIQLR